MVIQSYAQQRDLAKVRSLSCRVVFLTDVLLQGSIDPADSENLPPKVIIEQLSANSAHLVSLLIDMFFEDDEPDDG